MEGLTYKIKLKKDNFEVEVQGDKEWVEKKFAELTSVKGQGEPKHETGSKDIQFEKTQSLVEFFNSKGNPSGHANITVVCAYWLLKAKKVEFFTSREIEDCYDLLRESKPKNMTDILNGNIEKRWFSEHEDGKDGKKAWEILRSGLEYVEQMKKQ